MKHPKTMNEYLKQVSFTDAELNYMYNYMDILQRMVKSIGPEYNAIWRTIFSDMGTFEQMLIQRNNRITDLRGPIEKNPKGINRSNVDFMFNIDINENITPGDVRNQLIRHICNLNDKEIKQKINSTKAEEPNEDILNVFQDNL